MANNKENMELESFLVTKHSWKGKYKRILSIGTTGISTYHPDRFDETNRWPYSDVLGAAPNRTSGNVSSLFIFRDIRCVLTSFLLIDRLGIYVEFA